MALYDPPATPAARVLHAVQVDPAPAAAALGLTTQQVLNLAQLATYLRTLPADYGQFAMRYFYDPEVSESWEEDEPSADYAGQYGHACGTAACAVGHGPAAGVAALPDERWEAYAARAFTAHKAYFEVLFGGCWQGVDNTPRGAAARIACLLDGGFNLTLAGMLYRANSRQEQPYLTEAEMYVLPPLYRSYTE